MPPQSLQFGQEIRLDALAVQNAIDGYPGGPHTLFVGASKKEPANRPVLKLFSEPTRHPFANVLSIPDSILHKRNIDISEEVKIVTTSVRDCLDFRTSRAHISLVPYCRGQSIGIADEYAIGFFRHFIFEFNLAPSDMNEFLAAPFIAEKTFWADLHFRVFTAIFRNPDRVIVTRKGLRECRLPGGFSSDDGDSLHEVSANAWLEKF